MQNANKTFKRRIIVLLIARIFQKKNWTYIGGNDILSSNVHVIEKRDAGYNSIPWYETECTSESIVYEKKIGFFLEKQHLYFNISLCEILLNLKIDLKFQNGFGINNSFNWRYSHCIRFVTLIVALYNRLKFNRDKIRRRFRRNKNRDAHESTVIACVLWRFIISRNSTAFHGFAFPIYPYNENWRYMRMDYTYV